MPQKFTPHQRFAIGALIVLAIVPRVYGLGFGLPHWFTRPDEETAIIHAIRMAQGHPNPQWFHWPTLYMYVLAVPYALYFGSHLLRGIPVPIGIAELYFAHPAPFHLIDRGISAALGALSVYVLYRLTRTLLSEREGLLAAFFLALAPLHVRDSHFGVTDIPATCMVLAAVLAAAVWYRASSRPRLLVAGALCGLAASVKYNAGIVLVAAFAAVLLRARGGGAEGRRGDGWRTVAANLAMVCAAAGAAFLAGTPYALLTPKAFAAGVSEVSQHMAAGHGLDLGNGWWYHLHVTLRYGLGLPLLIASLAGAVWMTIARPRVALLLLSFPIVYYAIAGSTHVVFFRYALPVVPFLCLSAAFAVARLPGALALVVAVAMMAPAAVDVVRLDRLLGRTDTRVLAADWIRDHVSGGATLYQFGAIYGHLWLEPTKGYREVALAGVEGPFRLGDRPAPMPDLIVVQQSPLMYSRDVPFVMETAQKQYEPVASFVGYAPAQSGTNIYDPIDAFFLPLRGFNGVDRPGPNITIYRIKR